MTSYGFKKDALAGLGGAMGVDLILKLVVYMIAGVVLLIAGAVFLLWKGAVFAWRYVERRWIGSPQ